MGLAPLNHITFTTRQQAHTMSTTEQAITTSSIGFSPSCRAQETPCARAVSFNPRAHIRSISPVGRYSLEERDSYWFSQNDLALIQHDMAQTLMLMETNQPIDERTQCFRGLERRTRTALESKKNERNELLEMVAREYYMQKQYGNDESVLAEMYHQRCAQDTESAHLMGIVDADEAYSILLQDIVNVLSLPEDNFDEEGNGDDYSGNGRWNESLISIDYESDDPTEDLEESSSVASLTKDDLIKESHRQQRRLSCPPRVLQGSFGRAAAA